MFKYKNFLFIILVALLFRLPFFLFRGGPAGDEYTYFSEVLNIFRAESGKWNISPVSQPKLFFILLQTPVAGYLYWLTGNSALSISLFPFLSSLAFVAFFYYFARRMYGEQVAFWAGLICAVMPFTVYFSSMMLTSEFFIYFFILSGYFLFRYFETQKQYLLLSACLFLSLLGKIRVEGYGVYLVAALILFHQLLKKRKEGQSGLKNFIKPALIIILCPLVIHLGFWALAAFKLDLSAPAGSSRVLFGKAVGNLSRKISALFNVALPGGFLESNKFDYLFRNYYLLFYAGLTVFYDLLKTLFILPSRVLPPLFFIFIGLSFWENDWTNKHARKIEMFFLLSLLTLLIYPLIYFLSHSRYLFLLVPVASLFIAKGINRAESLLSKLNFGGKKYLSPRSILTALVLSYMAADYYFLELGSLIKDKPPVVFKAEKLAGGEYIEKMIDWLNHEYGGKNIPVMGMREWQIYLQGLETLDFPAEVRNVDGRWQAVPISLEKTIGRLRENGEALLVLFGKNLYAGESPRTVIERDYFRESLDKNLGFYDEGLELMRDKTEMDYSLHYKEFRPLVEGGVSLPGLSLIKTFELNEGNDKAWIFLYRKE